MSTIKIFQISYVLMFFASVWVLALNFRYPSMLRERDRVIEEKDNVINALVEEYNLLQEENRGCVASLKTCEVMLHGYTEGKISKSNNGSNRA